MKELTVRIRFDTPCLGNVKRRANCTGVGEPWPVFQLPRMQDGRIRLETSWWRSSLRFAADVLCRHQSSVSQIHLDPGVSGQPSAKMFKRFVGGRKYIKHEAFLDGAFMEISCVVPDTISNDDFEQLMRLVGRFKGISPFQFERQYGLFSVIGVYKKTALCSEVETISDDKSG